MQRFLPEIFIFLQSLFYLASGNKRVGQTLDILDNCLLFEEDY